MGDVGKLIFATSTYIGLTLLHSERPKLYAIFAFLSAVEFNL